MDSSSAAYAQFKERMRGTWEAGDFGQIARYSAEGAEHFVSRLNIKSGMRVLDVACGTGNLAIPAARARAEVIGVDIAANLVEQARSPRTIEMDYPFAEREVVQLFREYFGPTRMAFSRLDEAGQTAYAADLEALWREHNQAGDGRTQVRAEYLEVIAVRA